MFDKKREEYSPYVITKEQGINLDYCFLGPEIVGIYADLNDYQIVLNSNIDNDRQEDALQLLIDHHYSHRGIEKIIKKSDLVRFYGFHKELIRLNKVFVNSLISRKLQNENT